MADPYLRSSTTYKPFEYTLSNEHGGTDFVDAIITSIFGLQPAMNVSLQRRRPPVADATAPRGVRARLSGVPWQGELFDAVAGADGVAWVVPYGNGISLLG